MKIDNMKKARASLIVDQPFFASILLPMPFIEDENTKTFSTDGETIHYNPKWANELTLQETIFVLAHEVLHCVLDHMGRRGDRTPNRWNQAADYVINETLITAKPPIGNMPAGGLFNRQLTKAGGYTAEGVYKILPESDEGKGTGDKGGALDQVHDSGTDQGAHPTDPAKIAERSAQLKVRVLQAKNVAKMAGNMPQELERLVDDAFKPVIDWRSELWRFFSERARIDYSFARPKRRFLSEDIYLPSMNGVKMGYIVIAVDCSGSVDHELLSRFGAEINAVKEEIKPSHIDIIYFESRVTHVQRVEEDEELVLQAKGGGGTAFSPVFKHIEKNFEEMPLAVVVLTDLYCDDFGKAPPYPVLWATLEGAPEGWSKVPFGHIIEVKE